MGYPAACRGYGQIVQGRPLKAHIVSYTCDRCGATHTARVGLHTDGMCPACGSPMKIDDLFSDRRLVSVPVPDDRRDRAGAEAA